MKNAPRPSRSDERRQGLVPVGRDLNALVQSLRAPLELKKPKKVLEKA